MAASRMESKNKNKKTVYRITLRGKKKSTGLHTATIIAFVEVINLIEMEDLVA